MYAKGKGSQVPSDAQAKEKLALYVYDYLMHIGATKSANLFLSEIRWEKQVQIGLTDPPGFLLSWWCVFWDLYCAAPERRDAPQNEFSNEAKAFHDYGFINSGGYNVPNGMPSNVSSHSPLNPMTPQENMPPNNPVQQNNYFNSGPPPPPTPQPQPNQMMMQNQPYQRYPSGPRPMRVASNSDFNNQTNLVGSQMNMQSNTQPRWTGGPASAGPTSMNYSSPSPVPYGVSSHGPSTPIIQSPQDSSVEMNYGMMKNVPGGMSYHDQNLSHMVPMSSTDMHHQQHMNGDMIESLKSSPISNMQASNSRHPDDHTNTGPINDMATYGHFGDGSVSFI